MQKIKFSFFIIIICASLIFLFVPEVLPENLQFKQFLSSTPEEDVIIIFNSGGWGNTPLEEARDFKPIIDGIEKSLQGLGYKSIVVPYERTREGFLGKITGLKGIFRSFSGQTEAFVKDLEMFLDRNPNKKIVVAGLCAGADFSDNAMEKISWQKKDSVFAIEVGTPFWENSNSFENVLHIDNNRDALAKGRIMTLLSTFFKDSFRWALKKIYGEKAAFARVLHLDGHDYFWPELEPEIVPFLATSMSK